MLDKEEWRYDQFPEFYNGKNVLDFYDPDIEAKLAALEKEEDEILKMEAEQADMAVDSEDSEGIAQEDLDKEVKDVRGKRNVILVKSKMKSKLKARRKIVKASELIEHFESKGIEVNKESLRSRSKTRRSLMDLEDKADKLAKQALDSSDDEGGDVVMDKKLAKKEAELRGRKRRRGGSADAGDMMEVDDDNQEPSGKKKARSMTPAQLQINANKILRSKTKDRREGSTPKRLPYKLVPEEQVRLAKKINKRFKHGEQINEADRSISTKRPKHLFVGKMSNGTRNKR